MVALCQVFDSELFGQLLVAVMLVHCGGTWTGSELLPLDKRWRSMCDKCAWLACKPCCPKCLLSNRFTQAAKRSRPHCHHRPHVAHPQRTSKLCASSPQKTFQPQPMPPVPHVHLMVRLVHNVHDDTARLDRRPLPPFVVHCSEKKNRVVQSVKHLYTCGPPAKWFQTR